MASNSGSLEGHGGGMQWGRKAEGGLGVTARSSASVEGRGERKGRASGWTGWGNSVWQSMECPLASLEEMEGRGRGTALRALGGCVRMGFIQRGSCLDSYSVPSFYSIFVSVLHSDHTSTAPAYGPPAVQCISAYGTI